jgi:ribosomal protein S15P/S13E
MQVARRRKLLDYLKRTAGERYKQVLDKLNLRK